MPTKPKLEFFYEFASTYSYLTGIRIDDLAERAGIDVAWRPFLLGPIFASQGWTTSPFNLYPAKGRYMVRDIERIAKARGRKFIMPSVFPANGLAAARIALAGEQAGWIKDFSRRVYEAQFEHGADISSPDILRNILDDLKLDTAAVMAQANAPENKDRLRAQSTRAAELGLFGAPSFVTPDGELFWGDDRLEQAISWTLSPQGA
ncbi:MAG: 2-hydroxychromene-2-carboxylate isomerase [Hyphomicrobiaceae bacterium]|nr:2-hydroxychromene-2-carboxylate isomerase [Hyphomicrobiaceae bacterium]